MTHYIRRPDARWIGRGVDRRQYVPTVYGEAEGNTQWIDSVAQLRAVGGGIHFNEDQTEIILTLPEGYKFSCRFHQESN